MIINDRETQPRYGETIVRKFLSDDDIERIVSHSDRDIHSIAIYAGLHPIVIPPVLAALSEQKAELERSIVEPDRELAGPLADARVRVLAGEDFQQVVNDLTIESFKGLAPVVSYSLKPMHETADAFADKLRNAVKFGFARGRASVDKPALKSAVSQAQALVALSAAPDMTKQALLDVVTPILHDCFISGGQVGFKLLTQGDDLRTAKRSPRLKMRFDVKTDRAIKWAERHAAELVKDISKTTRNEIKSAVIKAFESGTPRAAYENILDAIGDPDRADLIARTEVMRAANAGQREAWFQALESGLLPKSTKRVWLYTPDGSACDECSDLDGTMTSLDGQYPNDGGEGPPLHPRCRCTEAVIV